jgi:hypothetical protein
MAGRPTAIKDLLLSDDAQGQAELLLNLLSEAAAGQDISNVVSDVIQVGGWSLLQFAGAIQQHALVEK